MTHGMGENTVKNENYYRNLRTPVGRIDVVIDTDTFNEIDDQFALAYLLASSDKLNLKEIYAAPFFNHHSKSPRDGMERSYEEILRLLELTGKQEYISLTYKGSERFLLDEKTPVHSDAAQKMIKLAANYDEKNPLYVIAIGALTNVASALLLKPEIADRIVVVWLGGNSREYHDTWEFNMYQDIAAARVVFASGAPVVQLPCFGVVSSFAVSFVELECHLAGKNKLCDFLVDRVRNELSLFGEMKAPSRVLWDVAAVAWLLNEDDCFMLSRLTSVPIPEYDHQYSYDISREMRYVYYIKRDELVGDLFEKLETIY